MDEPWRVIVIAVSCAAASAWFGFGCVAPLTPSEGMPSPLNVAIFYVLPLGVCGYSFAISTKPSEKVFVGTVLGIIFLCGGWVLSTPILVALR